MVATLEELDEPALVKILTEPKNAITKQFRKLFEMEGVELEFRPDALTAIAKKALKRKTGARGLRTIVESVLLDTMYDLPSLENVKKVVVDESVVEHKSEPYLIYETRRPRNAAGSRPPNKRRPRAGAARRFASARRRDPITAGRTARVAGPFIPAGASMPKSVDRPVLPVLPLRDVVVFPHMVIPLFVGREKSIVALEQAMAADKRIVLVAQKSAETDDPGAADLYPSAPWRRCCSC